MTTDSDAQIDTQTNSIEELIDLGTDIDITIQQAESALELSAKFFNALVDIAQERAVSHSSFVGLSTRFVARAAQSLMSVTELAQRGLVGDAMSVARTIVEMTIDLGYIATDKELLTQKFCDFSYVRDLEMAKEIEALNSGDVDQEAMRLIQERSDDFLEANPSSKYNWASIPGGSTSEYRRNLRWRSEHVAGDEDIQKAYKQLYKLLYQDMCGASHSGEVTLRFTYDNRGVVCFGPQAPNAKPIRLALLAFFQLLNCIVRECEIKHLEDELSNLWNIIFPKPPTII